MNGVIADSVSAGSSHFGAIVTWVPTVTCPSCAVTAAGAAVMIANSASASARRGLVIDGTSSQCRGDERPVRRWYTEASEFDEPGGARPSPGLGPFLDAR